MQNEHLDGQERIQGYLLADIFGRKNVARTPPFSLLVDDATKDYARNYAIPDRNAAFSRSNVRTLIELFRGRDRTPRLEFMPTFAPGLERRLLEVGFLIEARLPLMAVLSHPLPPIHGPHGIDLEIASGPALIEAANIQNKAFGAGPATPADVDRLRNLMRAGGRVVIARTPTGMAVGSGLVSRPREGVAEIAAIGVDAQFRRRGIGGAVADHLARTALEAGVALLFLTAGGDAEARMYKRIGFERVGEMLHMVLSQLPDDANA